MKRSFILISLFLTFSNADYLNTKASNSCITDLTPFQNNTGWCYVLRTDNAVYCDSNLNITDLINGYIYLGGSCVLSDNLKLTGLDYDTYTSLQALQGTLYGFILTFMISFLYILLGRR